MEVQRMHHYLPHYTYEDYCQWEGRWELIDGIPVAMSPLPGPTHQRSGGKLFMVFDQALVRCAECTAYPPIDWKVKKDTVLQPDFLVVCHPLLNDPFLSSTPELVAEILSPSTAIKDRNAKFKIYEASGVKYYLIIDAKKKRIEVYELINNKYQLIAETPSTFNFTFHNNCSITVPFDELWD